MVLLIITSPGKGLTSNSSKQYSSIKYLMHDQETHLGRRRSSPKCGERQHMHRHNHGTVLRVRWMGSYL